MWFSKKLLLFILLLGSFLYYSVIVASSGTEALHTEVMSQEAIKGKFLFQELNCVACHQFYGLGGYMGPDLTNVITAPGKGEKYAEVFIRHGSEKMPNYNLNDGQVQNLLEYLKFFDKETTYPIKNLKVNYYGTVDAAGE
ncbi:MAG: cytochrome c [Bacteroidetes bacterium]|nr:cytochrome c [Bacteroidota bacterium]